MEEELLIMVGILTVNDARVAAWKKKSGAT